MVSRTCIHQLMDMEMSMVSLQQGKKADVLLGSCADNAAHPPIDPSFGFRMVMNGIKARFPTVHNVSTTKLEELRQAQHHGDDNARETRKLVIVDVRPEEEYNISHLPSAVRIAWETQDMRAVKKAVEDRGGQAMDVVMYCSVGYRSSALADRFRQALQERTDQESSQAPKADIKVYNLEGSLFKWANEGREMVDSAGQRTNFVHPYSTMWGRLVSKDIRKWPESKDPT